jgi:ATP-binding cassette subfamily C protein
MVALVGPSGAGKSTVTRLLLGFESPEDGQVLYDGRDLKDLDLTLVRRQMGVVVQEGTILRASILKNIVGSGSHDISAAWDAATSAAIADDIKAMPMGMQTIVDPATVSGGQAQRILLARALVNRPAIIILDEATSALDNESQAIVTQAMKDLKATRIVIAHRLSTIRSADLIIVIVNGVAVEQGTYDELMAMNGEFVKQVSRQIN